MPKTDPAIPRLEQFTGLRALAAIWVMMFHFKVIYIARPVELGIFSRVLDNGYLGVDLFFLLSGFVMSYVYQSAFSTLTLSEIKRYLALRVARIYPVHFFMLMVFLAFYAITMPVFHHVPNLPPNAFSIHDFFYSLFLIHAWGVADKLAWNIPSWSVSAEWFAYLTFPFVAFLLKPVRSVRANLFLIAALALLMFGFLRLIHSDAIEWTYNFGLVRVMIEFVMGCALFKLYGQLQSSGFRQWDTVAALLSAGLIFLVLSDAFDLVILLGLAGLILSLSLAKGWIKQTFENPFLVHLGEISYSVYLVHGLLMSQCASLFYKLVHLPMTPELYSLTLVVQMAIAFGLAHFTYLYIEKPSRSLLRAWFLEKQQPAFYRKIMQRWKSSDALQHAEVTTTVPSR